jgi:hypothetical protein
MQQISGQPACCDLHIRSAGSSHLRITSHRAVHSEETGAHGHFVGLCQCGPTGGPRATSGSRPRVAKTARLFVNLMLVTITSFIFFMPEELNKLLIIISYASLRENATVHRSRVNPCGVREEYKACRWTEDFILVGDKET